MDPLSRRVAARVRVAGFIPDKWWRTKKTELRKILTEPLNSSDGSHIRWKMNDDLVSFFQKFLRELQDFGLHQFAEDSVTSRVQDLITRLGKIAHEFQEFYDALNAVPYPPQGVEDEVAWSIQVRIGSLFEEKVKTLQDALKGVWKTDPRLIRGLAQRVLKKATPEERAAVEQASKEDYGHASRLKWEFFRRVNVDGSAKRLVSIDKKTWKTDPLEWIDFLKSVLEAVHTEDRLEAFTEFELYGVKVVVDDRTVSPNQINAYVKYLDETYHALKAKRLEKVWYGKIFIRCEDCGGFNPNTGKWKDVGGNYPIGPDVVNIFVRPSYFIVELMAHELGHRYWFKFMSQTQRGKFESLVRVHKSRRPDGYTPRLIAESKVKTAKEKVDSAAKAIRSWLIPLKTSRKKWFADIIKENIETIGRAGWTFSNDILDAVHAAGADSQINSEVKQLFEDVLKTSAAVQKLTHDFDTRVLGEIHREPDPAEAPPDRDAFWMAVYKRVVTKWLEDLDQAIEMCVASSHIYIDAAVQAYNKVESERQSEAWKNYNEEYDTDERPVTPVSDYGKSNIDEAFAEVFAHYIIGHDMTRDQLESFRSVLSSLSERVAHRFSARF